MSGRYWWLLTSRTRGWRRCRWWRSRAASRWRLFAARARRWAIGDFRRTSQSVPPNDWPLNMKTRSSKQLVRCCWLSIVLLLSCNDARRIKAIFASAVIDSLVIFKVVVYEIFSPLSACSCAWLRAFLFVWMCSTEILLQPLHCFA